MKQVIQGESETFTINLGVRGSDGITRPFDLTGQTSIRMCFKHSGGVIEKTASVVGAESDGKVTSTLSTADTAVMVASDSGTIETEVVQPSATTKFRSENAFQVIASICP